MLVAGQQMVRESPIQGSDNWFPARILCKDAILGQL